jgi:hypothetical protein
MAPAGDGGGEAALEAASPDAGTNTPPEGGTTDAAPTGRTYRMATTGEQLLVSGSAIGLQLTAADIAKDADVSAIHQEVYGIPWDAFTASTQPPPEWVSVMNGLAANAQAARAPVFLSVTMLDGTRQNLSPATVIDNGAVKTQNVTGTQCYDFRSAPDAAARRAAYLAYVDYMVGVFAPAFLDIAIEVNLFFEKCPAAAPGLVDVINAVYDAQKAKHPNMLVFPSIQIEHLYGYSTDSCPVGTPQSNCFATAYATISPIKRDRFAMSSYPYLNGMASAPNLPSDWFTRGPSRGGERGLISETGWLSTPIVAQQSSGTCTQVLSFGESDEAAYVSRVLADADKDSLDLVTWWSDRDLLVDQVMTNCPCTFDTTWCAVVSAFRGPPSTGSTDTQFFGEILLKAFGTMGLRDYTGTAKTSVITPWSEALARPFHGNP